MPSPARDRGRVELVFRAFERAANAGHAAPTNQQLCGLLGMASASGPLPYIAELEAAGRIRVERYHRNRRVTIVETGRQTALPAGAKPGRYSEPDVRPAPPQQAERPVVHTRGPDGLQMVPPFVAFTEPQAEAFQEALDQGFGIETAARHAGRSLLDGYRHWHRMCAELGEDAA